MVDVLTERYVDFEPPHRAGYVVVDDLLGFSRLPRGYGFTMTSTTALQGARYASTPR